MLALALGAVVLHSGIPALRHDWQWPTAPAQLRARLSASYLGWDASGFGLPYAVIGGYGIAILLSALSYALPSTLVLGTLIVFAGWMLAFGAMSFASDTGADAIGVVGNVSIGVFALANPFVYDETVAGHTFMLLSCGAAACLVAYARSTIPRSVRLILLLALAAQLQFLILVGAALAAWEIRRRAWRSLAEIGIVALPVAVAIAANLRSLSRVPVLDVWQRVQSVDMLKAIALQGYFAGYDAAFSRWPMLGLDAAAILFVVACLLPGGGRRARAAMLAGAIAIVVVVSGAKGPLAGPFLWTFAHFKPAGAFREIFDLMGLLAILYFAGIARLMRRLRSVAFVLAAIDALLLVGWIRAPIATWWVPAGQVPLAAVSVEPAYRFALAPEFQPISMLGRGSGTDPDAIVARNGAASLNAYAPSIPAARALNEYRLYGATRDLAALGVTRVVARPYFNSSLPGRPGTNAVLRRAIPLFSTLAAVGTTRRIPALGSADVFVADTPRGRGEYRALHGDASLGDPARGWVAAWVAFANHPHLAQPYGGAYTTSSLPIRVNAPAVLAAVRGQLVALSGRTLSGSTHGYAWVKLPSTTRAVRCIGRCLIALGGPLPAITDAPARRAFRPLAYAALPAFIYVIRTPKPTIVRYNASFDSHWLALSLRPLHLLRHFRIAASANAWNAPSAGTVVIANWLTLLDLGLIALPLGYLVAAVVAEIRRALFA